MKPFDRSFLVTCIFGTALAMSATVAFSQDTPPAPKVSVAAAYMEEITTDTMFIARGEALDKVDIVARVDGFVEEVAVADGASVEEGDLLFQIEAGTYQATLDAREADKETSIANLRLSEIELDRKTKLFEREAGTEADRDIAIANNQVAQANILIADAAIDLAKLDVSYTQIAAPFKGRIGRIIPSVGELVGPTTGPLVTLIRTSPIYVEFSLTEKQLINITNAAVEAGRGEAETGSAFDVYAVLPNGSEMEEIGRFAFVDNRVDPATGSIQVRVKFENERGLISDGSFLQVRIEAAKPTNVLLIPQAAIQRDQRGDFVLVVGSEQNVEQRYITTGRQVEAAIVVEDGLVAGEAVIVEGLQRVRPGAAVDPVAAGTSTTTEGH